ncbi:MAG: glycosyltransferase [Acidobacteria bacterium]|nr:MAG: glycosyltransferase [Acidobacteriota bacterium]
MKSLRVVLRSEHCYSAEAWTGTGLQPRVKPSGAAYLVHDKLAKGLAELGHRVYYLLEKGATAPLPPGVELVSRPVPEADVYHNLKSDRRPWILTCHRFDPWPAPPPDNWVYVSRFLAGRYGRERFVWNGLDPQDYVFTERKEHYFLFISAMGESLREPKFLHKGLDVALELARRLGFPLWVAGTGNRPQIIERVASLCAEGDVFYAGDVRGMEKARLLAGARALLFPTRLPEGCPLVMIEALMSGTPVICSDRGACPELITPEVGFVCSSLADWERAIAGADRISPQACRQLALERFHYRSMAEGYVREYRRQMNGG